MTRNFIMQPTLADRARPDHSPVILGALVALTFTTGLVDAVSLLGLGKVFTANMTGNLVLLGFAIAGTGGFSVVGTLTSLLGFAAGAAAASVIGRHVGSRAHGWMRPALCLELTLILAAAVLATQLTPSSTSDLRYVGIALLAAAMGARSAAVRSLGVKDLNTTVITMTLAGLASESRLTGGTGALGWRQAGGIAALLVGAIAGALLLIHVDLSAPLFLAAAVAAVDLVLLVRLSGPRPSPGE
jgi:uncharacterized membrane protein YoaK (UPF0700 family)